MIVQWICELTLAGTPSGNRVRGFRSSGLPLTTSRQSRLPARATGRLPRLRLLAVGDEASLDNQFAGWIGESFHASPRTAVDQGALEEGVGPRIDVLLLDTAGTSREACRRLCSDWKCWPRCKHAFTIVMETPNRDSELSDESYVRSGAGLVLAAPVAPQCFETILLLEFQRMHRIRQCRPAPSTPAALKVPVSSWHYKSAVRPKRKTEA